MNENYIKIESKSNVENIAPIRICIATFLSSLNIHIDDLMDVKTALSEAVTNAVDHAYESGEDNKIVVEAKVKDNERIIITVKDFGKGIEDISLAMTPMYTSKPENEHAGMGFTIMESFMDEVIVDSVVANGTTITLTKDIKRTISNKV
jgi:stage II sporulation protein AB (anti-sigma F factor)